MATRPSPTPIELRLLDIYQRLERINNDVLSQIAESLEKNELEAHQREELALKLLPMIQKLQTLRHAVSLELNECKAVIFVEESSANTYIDMMRNAGKFLFKSKWKIGTAIAIAVFVVVPYAFMNNMIFIGHPNQESENQYSIENEIQSERRSVADGPRKSALKGGTNYLDNYKPPGPKMETTYEMSDEDAARLSPWENVCWTWLARLRTQAKQENIENINKLEELLTEKRSKKDEKEFSKGSQKQKEIDELIDIVFAGVQIQMPDAKAKEDTKKQEEKEKKDAEKKARLSEIENHCWSEAKKEMKMEYLSKARRYNLGQLQWRLKDKRDGVPITPEEQKSIDYWIIGNFPSFKEELESERRISKRDKVQTVGEFAKDESETVRREKKAETVQSDIEKNHSEAKDQNMGTVTQSTAPKGKARFQDDPVKKVTTFKIARTEEDQEANKRRAEKPNKNMGHKIWGQKDSRPKVPSTRPELEKADSETFEAMPDEEMERYIKARLTPAENECWDHLEGLRKQAQEQEEQEMIEKINELELPLNKKRQTEQDIHQFPKNEQTKIDALFKDVCEECCAKKAKDSPKPT